MDWFRYYNDTLENRKIQSLPAPLFKVWVNFLCVARIYDGVLPEVNEISYRLRCPSSRVRYWIKELQSRNLLDVTNEGEIAPHDWDEYQKNSDDAAGRKRRQRLRQQSEMSRDKVGTCPVLETETETEKETEKEQKKNEGKRFPTISPPAETDFAISDWAEARYARHPKKGHRGSALRNLSEVPEIADPAWREEFTNKHEAWIACERWKWKGGASAPYLDEWILDKGWLYDPPAEVDDHKLTPTERVALQWEKDHPEGMEGKTK